MAQVVVADASVLIALAQIGQLSLLERLYAEVVIPSAVQSEVAPSVPKLPPWVHTQTLQRPLDSRVAHAALDAGETEAISLALETRAQWVILVPSPGARGMPPKRQARRGLRRTGSEKRRHHSRSAPEKRDR